MSNLAVNKYLRTVSFRSISSIILLEEYLKTWDNVILLLSRTYTLNWIRKDVFIGGLQDTEILTSKMKQFFWKSQKMFIVLELYYWTGKTVLDKAILCFTSVVSACESRADCLNGSSYIQSLLQ